MPAHGHGSNVTPTTAELGGSAYRIEHVVYTMPGLWELRFEIEAGGVSDEATVSWDVE